MADNTPRDVETAETEDQLKVEINGEKDDTLRIKTVSLRNSRNCARSG